MTNAARCIPSLLVKTVLASSVFALLPSIASATMTQVNSSGIVPTPGSNNGYEITGSYNVIIPGGTTVNMDVPTNGSSAFSIAQDTGFTSTVTFSGPGSTTVSGDVGDVTTGTGPATVVINEVDLADSQVAFSGTVYANDMKLIGTGTSTFNDYVEIANNIEINAPGTLTFNSGSYPQTTEIVFNTPGGIVNMNDGFSANIVFAAGTTDTAGTVNMNNPNAVLSGSILNTSGNPYVGNFNVEALRSISGDIGAPGAENSLGTVSVNGSIPNFESPVFNAKYLVLTGSQFDFTYGGTFNTVAIYNTDSIPTSNLYLGGATTINGTVGTFPGTQPFNYITMTGGGLPYTNYVFNNDTAVANLYLTGSVSITFNGALKALTSIASNADSVITFNGNTALSNITTPVGTPNPLTVYIGDGTQYFPP